jgi:hypothetical protein
VSPPVTHAVGYTSNDRGNADLEHGVALVTTGAGRPSWHDCRAQIPGFISGEYLGLAPNPPKEQRR